MIARALDYSISTELASELRSWRNRAGIVGVIGAVLLAVGLFVSPAQMFRSYLWSYLFILGLSSGALAWLMLQYLTGGAWGVVVRRPCEAAVRAMPLVALLFIPIFVGIPNLYEWSHSQAIAADEVLQHKAKYLNVPFFTGRAILYFAGWLFLAWFFNRWSAREDSEGGMLPHRRMSALAGPGILFWGLSVTFMSIDWVMSLNPHWFSTMFGLLFIAGQALNAMAFLIIVLALLSFRRPLAGIMNATHLHDLGKLLLALVMVWAYFSFSQFLIIWAGNLPSEVPWYVRRLNGGWQYVALALVLGHFALPFALLLSRDLKRNFKLLAGVSVFVLVMRLVDLYWVTAPDALKGGFSLSWMDFAAPAALIGLWLAYFLHQLAKRPLLPVNDPHLEEALEHGRE